MKIRCLQKTFRQPTITVGESTYHMSQNDLGHWIVDIPDERNASIVLARRDTFETYDYEAEKLKAAAAKPQEPQPPVVDTDEAEIAALKAQEEELARRAAEQAEADAEKKRQAAGKQAEKDAQVAARKAARKPAVVVPAKDATAPTPPDESEGGTADQTPQLSPPDGSANATDAAQQQSDATQSIGIGPGLNLRPADG